MDFSESELVVPNMSYPADICFNQFDNILAVPNSGNNTIEFFEFSCDNSNIQERVNHRNLKKRIDILGRDSSQKGLIIEIYDDNSIEKKYFLY